MATRNTTFAPGEFYHIYNRGNSKQKIFYKTPDYGRFQLLLYLSNTSKQFNIRDLLKSVSDPFKTEKPDELVKIGAYCLMPNHFHLLLSPVINDGVSKFMLKLGTAYTMYINTKYDRSGSLYEGRYKSKFVDSDEYLKYLFSYIHLNPVTSKKTAKTIGLTDLKIENIDDTFVKAKSYPYSSLTDYLTISSPRAGLGLVDTSVYEMYFGTKEDIKRELFDWLQYEEPTLGLA